MTHHHLYHSLMAPCLHRPAPTHHQLYHNLMPPAPPRPAPNPAQVQVPHTPLFGLFALHTPTYDTQCLTPCIITILGDKIIPHKFLLAIHF